MKVKAISLCFSLQNSLISFSIGGDSVILLNMWQLCHAKMGLYK